MKFVVPTLDCPRYKKLLNVTTPLKAAYGNMKIPTMYWLPKLHKTPYLSCLRLVNALPLLSKFY